MLRNLKFKFVTTVAALALASSAFAAETIHYSQDFTDGSIADEVGSIFGANAALGIRTQESWRDVTKTYYGPTTATAFDEASGFGSGKSFQTTTVNGATLSAGNVWVFDISLISDLASEDTIFFGSAPGAVVEEDWTSGPGAFTSGAIAGLRGAVNDAGVGGMAISTAYPNGADAFVEPSSLPGSLADAALPAALDKVLRAKYVYQPVNVGTVSGFTRASVQVLDGNTAIGSAGHTDGGAGSFRSDYTGGLFVQVLNNHGAGSVTYSAGATAANSLGDGTDVAYSSTLTGLELGLTKLVFKQVSQADNTTDGNVDLSDASNLIGNWQGTGKNFFQGDTDGNGTVDLTDASNLIGAWTAAGAGGGLEEPGKEATVALGTGAAYYDPSNGHIMLDVNGVALWQLNSAGAFIGVPTDLDPGAGVRWTIPNTTKQADASVIGEFITGNSINYANVFNGSTFQFDYVATQFGGDIGQLLPAGLQSVEGMTFSYQTLGNQLVTIPLGVIPEPATAGLVMLSLGGLLTILRRRRA